MSLRDMVTGGANCSAPGERRSSSANPLGALADSLLGSAAKAQASECSSKESKDFNEKSVEGPVE